MATLALTLTAGGTPFTKSVTLSEADAIRLRDAMRVVYGLPAGTTTQVFDRLASGLFNQIKSTVIETERAAQQPVVPDLPMT